MMITKARKYMVIQDFGYSSPTTSMFKIEEEMLPELKTNQFLVKAEYISVDPYMRSFASDEVPYLQFGFQVGKVMQSKHREYPVESYVVAHAGWRDLTILDGKPDEFFRMKPYQPQIGQLPLSLAVGALGMPGITAYLGFLEVCKPHEGDIVCVTSACGAVGSLVGQIARIKGCTVIGFTGTDEKVQVLKELRFDHGFNYRTVNVKEVLKTLAPHGVNCFFDNVGGSLYNDIIKCMADRGRVARCGEVSTYNNSDSHLPSLPPRPGVHIEAFSFSQWSRSQQQAALKQIREWIESGQIIAKETITHGFDKLPDAFVGMLKGENFGKAVVEV